MLQMSKYRLERTVRLMRPITILVISICIRCLAAGVSPCPDTLSISVVYNALLWPDQDWELLIRSQLEHLKGTGLAGCSAVYVVMSVPAAHGNMTYEQLENLLGQGKRLVRDVLGSQHGPQPARTIVSQVHENSFEFPALHLLWLLAQVDPSEIITHVVRLLSHDLVTRALGVACVAEN